MKKALIIVFLTLVKTSIAQEAAPFKVHAKAVSRITAQTNSSINNKVADGIISGKLALYTDEACTLKMQVLEQKALLQKKVTQTIELQTDGKVGKKDTVIIYRFGPGWIGQYKMGPAGQLGVFVQFPEETKTPAKWNFYIKPSEYRKLLSELELDFLSAISADGGVPLTRLNDFFWASFERNRGLWLSSEIKKYKNAGLSDSLSNQEYQETYKIMAVETVVPDSAHREFDYQRSVFLPLTSDSLKGFSFKCALRKDPSGGQSLSLSPVSISPLWDPSGTGGDPFMLETTFWVAAADFFKKLNVAERNKLTLLTLLFLQERMDTDCTF